jgi:hypothetical protein
VFDFLLKHHGGQLSLPVNQVYHILMRTTARKSVFCNMIRPLICPCAKAILRQHHGILTHLCIPSLELGNEQEP